MQTFSARLLKMGVPKLYSAISGFPLIKRLRVIICKDQTETENFDSGVLKISSYSHMLVITWY